MRTSYAWLQTQWNRLPEMLQDVLGFGLFAMATILPGVLFAIFTTQLAAWVLLGSALLTGILWPGRTHAKGWRYLRVVGIVAVWLLGGMFIAGQVEGRSSGRLDSFGYTITPEMRAAAEWREELRQKRNTEKAQIIHNLKASSLLNLRKEIEEGRGTVAVNDDLVSGTITFSDGRTSRKFALRKINGTWQAGCTTVNGWQSLEVLATGDDHIAAHLSKTSTCPRI